MQTHGVKFQFSKPGPNLLVQFLLQMAPLLLLFGLTILFMRQMQGGARGAMGFGKSKARLLTENKNRVTFEDVAGVDEAKEDLTEIVDFLKDPAKFQRLGGKIPKGALMVGPPGTGKTLLGRAVAGEAGVPFFFISGSDFVEMFVGVGASRVRDMFEQAKKNAPCIIFIDEIDAVGRHRGAGLGGGNDEREQTLNQLLVEMDGFDPNEGIIVIAATNRPDVLDPALLRPGRFDRQVVVPNPDIVGRERILRVHMRNVPLAADVDVKVIARGTPGFSGADLANLVNEAALMAARKNRRMVTQPDFEDAKDKVMMGAERKSMVMTEDEKRMTAYHEGGHALVALNVPATDPVHKATIIPRGRALGMVMQLPERDKLSMTYEQMTSRLAILYGGRVAEELIFGKEKITSGASNDISQATKLARAMVTKWGYSDELGIVEYGENQEEVFLGHSVARNQNVSEDTAKVIDAEIKRLTQAGYAEAKRIMTEKLADLHTLAKALLEYETLSGDEIIAVLKGIPPRRDEPEMIAPPGPRSSVPLAPRPAPAPIPPAPRRNRLEASRPQPPRRSRGGRTADRAGVDRAGRSAARVDEGDPTPSARAKPIPGTPPRRGGARPLVMGIVNVTPDSFSDGGRFLDADAALAHARRLIAEGADILDIGGESTRPGAAPAGEAEEIARVVPVIEALRRESDMPISVDTMKPAVARAALAAGATMWNDVTALGWSPESCATAAALGCEVVLMHMQGEPRTMQKQPRYGDVVAEVAAFLGARAEAAIAAGVAREKIWVDPGFGFGKTPAHNLELIRSLPQIAALGFPVVIGASRKSSIARIAGDASTADQRLGGSIALALAAAKAGAAMLRVHDVAETRQALAVAAAIGDA